MAFETPFADAEVLRVVSKNSPKSLRNLIGATKSTNGSTALNGVRNQETVFGKWFCGTHYRKHSLEKLEFYSHGRNIPCNQLSSTHSVEKYTIMLKNFP